MREKIFSGLSRAQDPGFDIFSIIDTYALKQTNLEAFQKAGLTGDGIKLGIIDGGFAFADTAARLQHVITSHHLGETRNFLNDSRDIFNEASAIGDFHGSIVWHLTGGRDAKGGNMMGPATEATYYLASADEPEHESRDEEQNWIKALEWLQANEVRVVNSSLTYSTGYDDPAENYLPEQMDGKTTKVTRTASEAAEKGIILVVAAGNEGEDEEWQIIAAPADTENVITVGAADREGLKAGMSAVGSGFTPYVKPDVACYGFSGTSTTAPVITGMIACMLQKDPGLSPARVKDILVRSSDLYPFPNNYLGYGIPDARKILAIMNGQRIIYNAKEILAKEEYSMNGIASDNPSIRLFHKIDVYKVSSQELYVPSEGSLTIKRPSAEITRTTIAGKDFVREVVWQ
ncbi:S8 family serine peptidase [Roseivirga sp. BDSF3-8]|uniref:S8 family serine peptidase n=1 Tax=Roseivirga sp. BDSF3-8 TaxID=3241598 RepID=UPI0035325D53